MHWRRTALGRVLELISRLGVVVPNFWLAILLISLFGTMLHWFSAGGFPGWSAGPIAVLGALTLPALALALPQAAILTRVLRAELLEAMAQDFVRSARAKGAHRAWRRCSATCCRTACHRR